MTKTLAGRSPRGIRRGWRAEKRKPTAFKWTRRVQCKCAAELGDTFGISRTLVMPALGTGIHDFEAARKSESWMAGPRPANDNCLRPTQHRHARPWAGHPRFPTLPGVLLARRPPPFWGRV